MTYNCDLFDSFTLGRMSFHQLLTEYFKDIGVAIRIKEFHHIKVIKLIEMITYYFYLFVSLSLERISFHQLLKTYYREAFIGRVLNTTFVGIFYKSNFDQPTRRSSSILCPITGESCVVCGEPACLRR